MPKSKITKEQDKDVAQMYLRGMTAQQISEKYKFYKQSILNSLKRSSIERRKDWKRASGEKNGKWKGGIRMIKGYRHIHLPAHRLSRKDGWVAEHRLLKEKEIKNKKQIVHHKDGNRLNNKKTNLKVYKNNGVHRSCHSKTQRRNKKGVWN